jgi:hypothetical protein
MSLPNTAEGKLGLWWELCEQRLNCRASSLETLKVLTEVGELVHYCVLECFAG